MQGCTATIVMPTSTPAIKVAAVRALGGIVDLHGESYQEAQAHAQVGAAPGWWCQAGRRAAAGAQQAAQQGALPVACWPALPCEQVSR